MIACSACRTTLPAGASICPTCLLPITAMAMPVVVRQGRTPFIIHFFAGCTVLGLIVFIIFCFQNGEKTQAATSYIDHTHQEYALVQSLSTPEAFEAKCGKPAKMLPGISVEDGAGDHSKQQLIGATTLIYPRGHDTFLHVIFLNPAEKIIYFREHVDKRIYNVRQYDGFVQMGCGLR